MILIYPYTYLTENYYFKETLNFNIYVHRNQIILKVSIEVNLIQFNLINHIIQQNLKYLNLSSKAPHQKLNYSSKIHKFYYILESHLYIRKLSYLSCSGHSSD